jgi:hypothetical protein
VASRRRALSGASPVTPGRFQNALTRRLQPPTNLRIVGVGSIYLGFDVNIAGYGGGGPGSYWGEKNFSAAWRNGGHDWDVPHLEKYHGTDTFLTEALTLEMNRAITAAVAAGRPFFAHMSHYAVHAPFETDARFAGNYPDLEGMPLAFATLIEGMDQSLGDLIAHLEGLGVAETTLVIFYSDNGSDGPPNLPLRGKKGTRFEGGARVPMIVAWAKSDPKHPLQQALPIPPGSESDSFVVPADFLPTLTAIAGVAIPDDLVLDGHDLRAAIHRPTWPGATLGVPGAFPPRPPQQHALHHLDRRRLETDLPIRSARMAIGEPPRGPRRTTQPDRGPSRHRPGHGPAHARTPRSPRRPLSRGPDHGTIREARLRSASIALRG